MFIAVLVACFGKVIKTLTMHAKQTSDDGLTTTIKFDVSFDLQRTTISDLVNNIKAERKIHGNTKVTIRCSGKVCEGFQRIAAYPWQTGVWFMVVGSLSGGAVKKTIEKKKVGKNEEYQKWQLEQCIVKVSKPTKDTPAVLVKATECIQDLHNLPGKNLNWIDATVKNLSKENVEKLLTIFTTTTGGMHTTEAKIEKSMEVLLRTAWVPLLALCEECENNKSALKQLVITLYTEEFKTEGRFKNTDFLDILRNRIKAIDDAGKVDHDVDGILAKMTGLSFQG